jgi:hypothetical protein
MLEDFGYLGIFTYHEIFSTFQGEFKSKPEKFLQNLIELYTKNKEKTNYESDQIIHKLICQCLPKLEIIKYLIRNQLISKKEIVLTKIILDLYFDYYKCYEPYNNQLVWDSLIPVCQLFYSSLSKEDINYLYNKIKNDKDVFPLISKLYFLF